MKRWCQGYCGSMARLENMRTTADGERFCEDCYQKWKDNQ